MSGGSFFCMIFCKRGKIKMDMYGSYKSPFGYENGINGGVDSYGVDHSGFSTQDELQYQTARAEREK